MVIGAIAVLVIVIVVACVVGRCGKIVEGSGACKPFKSGKNEGMARAQVLRVCGRKLSV